MNIDSHQHFWQYTPMDYPWIDDHMSVLKHDFLPEDLQPYLTENNVQGCVSVQAQQTEAETVFLLQLAERYDFIKGVVGWVDLCADNAAKRLKALAKNRYLKGIRHIVQDEPDSRFMLRPDFQRGISHLARLGLTYDILIFPKHLESASHLISAFPNQPFVVDHIAKPYIKDGLIDEWKRDISKLAYFDNVHCKISGMVTEADWQNWTNEDFTPYIDVVVNAFGIDRLMFGSDWPVCLLAAEYGSMKKIVDEYFASFSRAEKEKFFGTNAINFYSL